MINSKSQLVEEAGYEIESTTKYLAKFAEDLAKSPSYTLQWSHDAFRYAAKNLVWSQIQVACLQEDVTLDHVIDEARRNALRGAMYPERSTSVVSNLMSQEVTSMWATVLERLTK